MATARQHGVVRAAECCRDPVQVSWNASFVDVDGVDTLRRPVEMLVRVNDHFGGWGVGQVTVHARREEAEHDYRHPRPAEELVIEILFDTMVDFPSNCHCLVLPSVTMVH